MIDSSPITADVASCDPESMFLILFERNVILRRAMVHNKSNCSEREYFAFFMRQNLFDDSLSNGIVVMWQKKHI